MPYKQAGFTLIELMITVAIIGILASMALPSYQEYLKRTRVIEGITLASSAKLSVSEYYGNHSALPNDGNSVGLSPFTPVHAVQNITVGSQGVITITFNQMVQDGGTLILTPSESDGSLLIWNCKQNNTLESHFLPTECRN